MQTEEATLSAKQKLIESKQKFLTDIILAAARYERLLVNKDFQDLLLDLSNLVKLHDDEIKGYLATYSISSSLFKKMRIAEIMGQHQLRRDQIQEGINYPQMLVGKAREAREELAKLKEQEKENTNV
jgi:hypothetical protein